ncbi:MAG TPA: AraC family transcriptional regulator [Blastocatellia bacterium]|nr:AraC family transcriptional regulator [Blastocatellia bacterium]
MQEMHKVISRPRFTLRHTITAECEFESHAHPAFTVASVLSGRLAAQIGGTHHMIVSGQTALLNMGQYHGGRGEGLEFVSIAVSPAMMSEIIAEVGSLHGTTEILFRTSVVSDAWIVELSRTIAGELGINRLGRDAMLDTMARQLVVHLLRTHLTVRKTASIELSRAGPVDRRLRRAIEFMHDNYSRDLALEEIAGSAYLSEYHFARLFKQITGVTPHFYLANLRIERARKLLLETALPISEIAAMVGYQSQSHFTRIFKSVTGATPRVFRNG